MQKIKVKSLPRRVRKYKYLYYYDIVEKLSYLFETIQEWYPKLDIVWFVDFFMNSYALELMDENNPVYSVMPSKEVIDRLDVTDLDGQSFEAVLKEADGPYFRPNELYWIGMMYAYLTYKLGIYSRDVYRVLPLDTMRNYYNLGHEMSTEQALEGILENVTNMLEIEGR